ncbi:uncharacterized protein LOC143225553 [Tachypleus tridentatus]|uniref:uncharacterized protein LOC143225553 n=1 Tax=Tachypleus tridentatus TaxID=6853 RepID=UPI003FD6A4CC
MVRNRATGKPTLRDVILFINKSGFQLTLTENSPEETQEDFTGQQHTLLTESKGGETHSRSKSMSQLIKFTVLVAMATIFSCFHEIDAYPRGFQHLALVKRPEDRTSFLNYDHGFQVADQPSVTFEHEIPNEWTMRQGPIEDTVNYLSFLDRLVKKTAERQDSDREPKRGGNRNFQTQGWRR